VAARPAKYLDDLIAAAQGWRTAIAPRPRHFSLDELRPYVREALAAQVSGVRVSTNPCTE
jgi:hypothetical protein